MCIVSIRLIQLDPSTVRKHICSSKITRGECTRKRLTALENYRYAEVKRSSPIRKWASRACRITRHARDQPTLTDDVSMPVAIRRILCEPAIYVFLLSTLGTSRMREREKKKTDIEGNFHRSLSSDKETKTDEL